MNYVCVPATIPKEAVTASQSPSPSSPKIMESKPVKTPVVLGDTGELQTATASVIMNILDAARMARFDRLRPTCRLACFITKWTTLCDRQLHRLVCCINSSLSVRMTGWVCGKADDLNPHAHADADLAGCCDSQRRTSGVHMAIEGAKCKVSHVSVQ